MRSTSSSTRRAATILAAPAILVGALLAPTNAQAAPAALTAADADTAVSLSAGLGADRTAGAYIDSATNRMVVTVTDASAAKSVRAKGAVAKIVPFSNAKLDAVIADLNTTNIAGTSWATDTVANQVVVSVDSTVKGADLAAIEAKVAAAGKAARLEKTAGTISTTIAGGQAIYAGGGGRCSLGFNVRSGSTYYFLTAGHCTNISASWYSNSAQTAVLGTRAGSSFPGNDYGIVRYTNTSVAHPSSVYLYSGSQPISSAGNATVGQSVRRSGSTTGVRSGSVTATNATVTYAEGRVSGLIRTTVCAQPGDSGGSLFAGSVALGLTSGGSGNCTSGGTTYFQPVTEALGAYGVTLP